MPPLGSAVFDQRETEVPAESQASSCKDSHLDLEVWERNNKHLSAQVNKSRHPLFFFYSRFRYCAIHWLKYLLAKL